MKKIILTLLSLACTALTAFAIPANPTPVPYTQPDGTQIMIVKHGDEWHHWVTDESGNTLVLDKDGYYRPATAQQKAAQSAAAKVAAEKRMRINELRKSSAASSYDMTHGERKIPVVLLEFPNKTFNSTYSTSSPKTAFYNLLNQKGYSDNGGKGSVKDYYEENSSGAFSPSFDVYGPVTVNSSYATYGSNDDSGNDTQPELAFYEACQKLDNEIDFSKYDYDNDGDVDMILFYYAGYGEADYSDANTIWPHQSHMMYSGIENVANNSFDGKRVNRYFCTSELQYSFGTMMAGIGTTAHEFGHSLGLPDMYDTNDSTDGSAGATYSFDIMCSGSYNSNQTCPPYFNAEERVMLGWMDQIPDIPTSGTITINPISDNVAYKTPTATEGEYFVYECREKQGWDAAIPSAGLIVYHVDKARSRHVTIYGSYTFTPYNLWTNWDYANAINCNGSHPCFYIVPAANKTSYNYSGSSFAFGSGSYTTYSPSDWNGNATLYSFSNISYSGGKVTMSVNKKASSIRGTVTDPRGAAVEGAAVTVASTTSDGGSANVTTGADGSYSVSISSFKGSTVTVTASAEGFYSATKTVSVGSDEVVADLQLRDLVDGSVNGLHKFDNLSENVYVDGFGEGEDIMAAVGFYPEELAPYAGRQIKSVSFAYYSSSCDAVHLIIDYGLQRKLTLEVPNTVSGDWNTVDLTDRGLFIPEGKDCYFGYAIKNPSEGPLLFDDTPSSGGGLFYADYNLTLSNWIELEECNLLVSVELVPLDDEYIPFNTIDNPGNGVYTAGQTFNFHLNEATVRKPTSIKWFFDDDPVSGGSIVLVKGHHVIEALVTENGKTKAIELEIEVK